MVETESPARNMIAGMMEATQITMILDHLHEPGAHNVLDLMLASVEHYSEWGEA